MQPMIPPKRFDIFSPRLWDAQKVWGLSDFSFNNNNNSNESQSRAQCFKNKMQSPDSNSVQTVVAESAIIRYLHAEGARVTRASLVSRDVTMKQVP